MASPIAKASANVFLKLEGILTSEAHLQLLPTWQHCKAYTSAFASWMKLYLLSLPQAVAMELPGAVMAVFERAMMFVLNELRGRSEIDRMLEEVWMSSLPLGGAAGGRAGGGGGDGGEGRGGGGREAQSTSRGVKLLLVLLLGRGVLATARELVGVKAVGKSVAKGGDSSSRSCEGGGDYIDCRFGIEGQYVNSPFPLMLQVIVLTLRYYKGLSDLRRALENSSSQEAAERGEGRGSAAAAAAAGEGRGAVTAAAAGEGRGEAAATAAAAGEKGGAVAAAGEGGGAAAARGGNVAGREVLPNSLAQLPLRGLPEAVLQQLDRVESKWPWEVLRDMQLSAAAAQQKELLQDLLLVVEVLLEEVPLPVGCSNMACVNLEGMSETRAAGKWCSGCKVVRYCSRECQVAHWRSHKGLCKRLQEEQGEGSSRGGE